MQARLDNTPLTRIIDRLRPAAPAAPARPITLVPRRSEPSIESPVAPPIDPVMLKELAELHGIPSELLLRQVELLRDIANATTNVPKSYRNVSDKVEDVQRAAFWLMSGATTQAGFRRFFGEEGFMRPTKSVAWDFYNRVFKRGAFGPPA